MKRPSLYKRCQGRVALARTKTKHALELLVEDYLRPEEPKDFARYLIASIAAENLTTAKEMAPVFAAWRAKAKTPIDAWLWFKALGAEGLLDSPASTIAVARDDKESALLRAVALRDLADAQGEESKAAVEHVLTNLPPADPDRALLLETCAAVIRTWGWGLKDDLKVRDLVEKLARTLDVNTLSIDTRDIVARHLAGLFHTDIMGPGSAPWLRELAAASTKPEASDPTDITYASGFFGLRAIGRRIVYVIDCSDSMLAPLTPDELTAMKPVTREDEPKGGKVLPKKDPDEPLPWQKIHNRIDAAREVLKRSLRAMKPEQSVCVILFGDNAKTLAATPNLKAAEPKTIAAAIAELDALKATPTPGDKTRPNGKLLGQTNLHGGIRLAFRVTTKGLLGPGEYVDLSKTGCDAVFVLSDGVPSTDDFRKVDKPDGEQTVKDRETMAPVANTTNIEFQGPYGAPDFESFPFLTDDVRRMNLFRQAEIHCVAIGEASDAVLQNIADYGGGKFRRVGSLAGTDSK